MFVQFIDDCPSLSALFVVVVTLCSVPCVFAGDSVIGVKINYAKSHPYNKFIHCIWGHNPGCNSMHDAYWSESLLLDIKISH